MGDTLAVWVEASKEKVERYRRTVIMKDTQDQFSELKALVLIEENEVRDIYKDELYGA
ncbi:unnamed protein product [Sphenostylis stenocarpa]|uniref:Uncharacterized protein n=1 Tax=Sphenostylis stenocarpa TaxID=92480 RepID=A0AA86VFB4_9FABA|nr:unnamed protein product [Sphenostylis stenocarpa]